jgi:hypothetical protein
MMLAALQVLTDGMVLPAGAAEMSAVAVLSAMITPAVLISACGSLAISTSNRLSRTIDRARRLSDQFAELARAEQQDELVVKRRALLYDQLERATRRSRMLQRAMTRIYAAIGVFVATSVAIGIVAATHAGYAWVPITLGLIGAGLLLHASVLLIIESRVALGAIHREMDFVWGVGQMHAPSEVVKEQKPRRRFGRRSE